MRESAAGPGPADSGSYSNSQKEQAQQAVIAPPRPSVPANGPGLGEGPGWRCFIPGCRTRGRRQSARSAQAADAGWRIHYLNDHYQQPDSERRRSR